MAIGIVAGAERDAFAQGLKDAGETQRAELLDVAAAVARQPGLQGSVGWTAALAGLAEDSDMGTLKSDETDAAREWAAQLDVASEFGIYLVWLAESLLELSVKEGVEAVRAFDLPERLSVLTMRSLSPHRE